MAMRNPECPGLVVAGRGWSCVAFGGKGGGEDLAGVPTTLRLLCNGGVTAVSRLRRAYRATWR